MKTFVWIIGKPGSGKTTVGNRLTQAEANAVHFSYGQLLKKVQPNPSSEGYSPEDRIKVNEIIMMASQTASVVVVDGNPYSELGFGFIEQIRSGFDQIKIVHLIIDDKTALSRLRQRSREVLTHDGVTEADRIQNFNKNLLPLIEGYRKNNEVTEIEVGNSGVEQVSEWILKIIK